MVITTELEDSDAVIRCVGLKIGEENPLYLSIFT
jgi:hypothetical protein